MNHKRISEISAEMSKLVDQQRALLNNNVGSFRQPMTPEELDRYAERNERLRELCAELNNVG